MAQFVADFGGSSKDLYTIVEREARVSDWFQKGCGVFVLKPGEKFEPRFLEFGQDILPDWPWLVRHTAFRIRFIVAVRALLYIQAKVEGRPQTGSTRPHCISANCGLASRYRAYLGIRLNSDLRPEVSLSQADFSGPVDILNLHYRDH